MKFLIINYIRDKLGPLLQINQIQNNVVKLKSKLPTISLIGVTENLSKDDIKSELCSQNEEIGNLVNAGQELSVIFTKPPTTSQPHYQIVMRVSPDIRKVIRGYNNKLHLGFQMCKVVDRFYVRRCNKCQTFGHYASDCEASELVCGFCMGSHDSNECHLKNSPHSDHKCKNCKSANLAETGHSTFWYRCPAYIIKQDKLKNSIGYDYNLN